ncbi:MAG: V-type ATP synthase subunit I [Candidatus Micrarchaeota archaeon]|nr:MAG: V-type ATP synthase subunit I [Candidatus Micrarchaeota archaeon]
MLRSEECEKVRIIVEKKDLNKLVSALHAVGVLDIREISIKDTQKIDLKDYESLVTELSIKVNSLLDIIKESFGSDKAFKAYIKKLYIKSEDLDLNAIKSTLDSIKFTRILKDKEELEANKDEINRLKSILPILKTLSQFKIDVAELNNKAVLNYKLVVVDRRYFYELRNRLSNIKNLAAYNKALDKNHYALLIAYKKELEQEVDAILNRYDKRELSIDLLNGFSGSPYSAYKELLRRIRELESKNKEIISKIKRSADTTVDQLLIFKEILSIHQDRVKAISLIGSTESFAIVEGWVPVSKRHMLVKELNDTLYKRYSISNIKTDELQPTVLRRPDILKPFDYFLNLYSVPRSDEIDPGWIFIVSFIIFYGMMISDVGYGLVSLVIAYLISRVTDKEGLMHNAAKLWMISSISAVVFGLLSNEFFGYQLSFLPTVIDWTKNVITLLAITVIFGVIQVCLGLVFGFLNKLNDYRKEADKKELMVAISKLTSILVIVFGAIAVSGYLFNLIKGEIVLISAIIAIVSIVLTVILGGIEGAEVTNLITHPISYARILGFGLASIIIATLIDNGFTPVLSKGLLSVVISTIVLLLLQFLNIILSMLEGLIQAMRLNFVEFFTKFYKGNGDPYKPFKEKRVYTYKRVI